MKPWYVLLCVSLLTASVLQAQSTKDPAEGQSYTIDFSITMRDLYLAAKNQDDSAIPVNKALILDGDIGTITVHEDTDRSFVVEFELLNGTWIGQEHVELYRAYMVCEGPEFRSFFSPQSQTRLKSGQTILVVGSYEGLGLDYDGKTLVPIVRVINIRSIY